MQSTDKHGGRLRDEVVRLFYEGLEPSRIDERMKLMRGTARNEIVGFWYDENKGALNGD